MTISGSRLAKPLSLLPFLYVAVTRLREPRDTVFLVVSSWLPAVWFLYRSSGSSLIEAVLAFVAGYIAFLSVYEIGYLANDGWDARQTAKGRQRIPFAFGPAYVALFLAIRVAAWVGIGLWTGWIRDPAWLVGYGALALAFAQHNLIVVDALRSASFFQLATLRFALPILAAVPTGDRLTLLVTAILFYTYLRFLSYLESKDLLAMPERRQAGFAPLQMAMLVPLALLTALIAGSWLVVELVAYFIAAYALPLLMGGNGRRAGP